MSWFDAAGLTSLAKSALKEAQKTIDKALDIQQESENNGGTMSQALWGSLFEPSEQQQPQQPQSPTVDRPKRLSTVSSESIEVLGSAETTPGDEPSRSSMNASSSVEVIQELSEGVKVLDDDEDTVSYNSLSDTATTTTVLDPQNAPITRAPARSVSSEREPAPAADPSFPSRVDDSFGSSQTNDSDSRSDRTVDAAAAAASQSEDRLSDSASSFCKTDGSDRASYEEVDAVAHASGDDLETAASSDIEIIPSPNGQLSTASSKSPPGDGSKAVVLGSALATKIRGHTRELSIASIQSDDDSNCSEVELLARKLAEMQLVLESREAKLVEISRNNVELSELNAELKLRVDGIDRQDANEVNVITEEYTQRLSALEKKFQQAIREKDLLRKQNDTLKAEAAMRTNASDLEHVIKEREETINELREEGEKLSKQQLHHSTIIKRLRAKEKDNEQVIKTLRDKVADQAQELDRMKRSISSKEALECTQIEAIYKLTTTNKKLDTELSETKGQLDDALQKFETVKKSFEAAKKEVVELQKSCGDQEKHVEVVEGLEKEKASVSLENERLIHQLEELRNKIRQDEQKWMTREATLRSEVSRQMARAEEAESSLMLSKNDIGSAETPEGSVDGRSLLAQLAALQESSLERDRRAQASERRLQQAAQDAQERMAKAAELNATLKEECKLLQAKIATVEASLSHASQKLEHCTSSCEEHMAQLSITLESSERMKKEYDEYKQEKEKLISEIQEKLRNCELQLNAELAALEAEKRRNAILQEQLKEATVAMDQHSGSSLLLARLVGNGGGDVVASNNQNGVDRAGNVSPHGSTGRDSIASESLGSGVWPNDDVDSYSATGPNATAECSAYSGSDAGIYTLERLQAALQRREGELRAARRAARKSHAQRTALARELAIHAAELDNMQSLQHQYDALLQMYGEKEEQLQELRLDLQDVKDMYKMQLDEILMLKKLVSEQKLQPP